MSDTIRKIAIKLAKDGPVKTLPTQRKVQLLFGGKFIVRTTGAVYVWEHPYYPQLYIPKQDLLAIPSLTSVSLKEGDKIPDSNGNPIATQYTITTPSKTTSEIILFNDDLPSPAEELRGLVKFDWGAMDQWFEEDAPIHVHPKDPFKRIDILPSTREIKISLDGHVLAHTHTSMHLYETGLPRRFYLPFVSILDPSILKPNSLKTQCPYKGEAEYYDVHLNGKVYENLFWYYTRPTTESAKIEGLVCPYNEKVDIEVDGRAVERPTTHFSNKNPNNKPSIV